MTDALFSTSSSRTMPAPIAASPTMNPSAASVHAREPMRELDDRRRRRRQWHDLAVTGRPMTAASRARSRRPHHRAPDDHDDGDGEREPGESNERSHAPDLTFDL